MKVRRSALKHAILPEDAVQAADLALWIEPVVITVQRRGDEAKEAAT